MSALNAGKGMARLRIEPYQPFPTDLLPYSLARFVGEASAAIGCDDSFVALPLLVGLAIAIGTTRRIRLKFDWLEFPVIWAVIVASSGQRKSPGFDAALRPLHDMHGQRVKEHHVAIAQYKRELLEYKAALAQYKQSGGAGDAPEEPVKPTLKRLIVNDTTIEALASILEENPRGVGVVRDELSGWLASFNQYRAGKGADASQWLELHRGGVLIVDRKTAERRTIYVPRAAASLGGTIQPGIIQRGYGREQFDSGMVARTLFAMPPARQRKWTDQHVEPHTRDRLAEIYAKLVELDYDASGKPIDLPLSREAQDRFIRFVNEHGEEQAKLGDERLEAAWSKLEGYAARLALVIHLVRQAVGDSSLADPYRVDAASVNAGITLARWFGQEARRVYSDMGRSDEDRRHLRLLELIQRKGGRISARELARCCHAYSAKGAAEQALSELVELKLGEWQLPPPGPTGGRPQKYFVLPGPSPSADIDQTSDSESPLGVLSAQESQTEGFVGAESDEEYDRLEREAIASDGAKGVSDG